MIVLKEDARFADADDEDTYQSGRKKPVYRDSRTFKLRGEVEESNTVRFEPPLYIQRYAKVDNVIDILYVDIRFDTMEH